MPETSQSATDFVIEGDTVLLAAQQEVAAAEASDDGMRMAHAYMELHDAGAHDPKPAPRPWCSASASRCRSCRNR
jgi:ATP-binding cassette subfamily F protein 3